MAALVSVAVPTALVLDGIPGGLSIGEAVFGFVMFVPMQALPVAVLYRAGPEMSAAGAWGTLVLAVVATVGGHVLIVTDDSSTAGIGFGFFLFYIAGGVVAAYGLDAVAGFVFRVLAKRGSQRSRP